MSTIVNDDYGVLAHEAYCLKMEEANCAAKRYSYYPNKENIMDKLSREDVRSIYAALVADTSIETEDLNRLLHQISGELLDLEDEE